jgi:hypothetical protein
MRTLDALCALLYSPLRLRVLSSRGPTPRALRDLGIARVRVRRILDTRGTWLSAVHLGRLTVVVVTRRFRRVSSSAVLFRSGIRVGLQRAA